MPLNSMIHVVAYT
ncbi:hypothetical protein F383_38500 [Gossypium arboreum]|uniref:Uncharacterized protein n=1 Tax=Gossypium arboreum TaxID=29729 RepID=A0A0B0MGY1_GOSAR|nr:hypothetical protein F383_38500 [Gossypium arboreum]